MLLTRGGPSNTSFNIARFAVLDVTLIYAVQNKHDLIVYYLNFNDFLVLGAEDPLKYFDLKYLQWKCLHSSECFLCPTRCTAVGQVLFIGFQAPIIKFHEYKTWRDQGVAFEMREDASYAVANRTLASGLVVTKVMQVDESSFSPTRANSRSNTEERVWNELQNKL